jgi:phosphinothricin acetyltransferase
MIRNAIADLSAIVDIYNAAIPGRLATADTEPVSRLLANPVSRSRFLEHPSGFSRIPSERIRGWLSFKPFYGRPAYSATASQHLCRSQRSTRRRCDAIDGACHRACAGVTAHDIPRVRVRAQWPSLALCRKFGFEQWGFCLELPFSMERMRPADSVTTGSSRRERWLRREG